MFDFLHLRRTPSARAHRAAHSAHREARAASEQAQKAASLAKTGKDATKHLRDVLSAMDTTCAAISTAARAGPVGTQLPDDLRRLLRDARKHADGAATCITTSEIRTRMATLAAMRAANLAADASEHAQEASEQKDLPEDARRQAICKDRAEREKQQERGAQ